MKFLALNDLVRFIIFSFSAIFFLLVFASFSHAGTQTVIQAHNVSDTSSQAGTNWGCVAFYVFADGNNVTRLNRSTLDTSTRLAILNTSGTPYSANIIGSCTVSSGNSCTLNTPLYASQGEYYECADHGAQGSGFTQRFGTASAIPIKDSRLNWTHGVLANNNIAWVDQTTTFFSVLSMDLTFFATTPISITSFTSPLQTNDTIVLQWTFTGDFQNLTVKRNFAAITQNNTDISPFTDTGLFSGTTYQYDLTICSAVNCDSANITATTLTNTPVVSIGIGTAVIFLASMLFCITLLAISLILIGFGSPLIKMLGTAFLIMFFILFPSIIDETNFISDITMIFAIKITCWSMAILSAIVAMVYLAYTYIFAPKEKGKYDYIYHR